MHHVMPIPILDMLTLIRLEVQTNEVKILFGTRGILPKIVSDNGPTFTSDQCKKFMQSKWHKTYA